MPGFDHADEGVDAVARDEGAHRRQRPDQLDVARGQADLLVGLAQRSLAEVLGGVILAPARKGDLPGVLG